MNDLLVYLLKSAGLLSIFYIAYQLLLQKDTSFIRNRRFLLSGIFTAALLPAITFTTYVPAEIPAYILQFQSRGETLPVENISFNWWQPAAVLYLGVFGILLIRFFLQIFSITKLLMSSQKISLGNYRGIETNMKTSPFSFFNNIVFNPILHSEEELTLILRHEKVHARQKHSIDILLANMLTVVLWFNPLSWLYKKAMEQNLEFIADSEAANNTVSRTAYQKALLKTTFKDLAPALPNNFYQSSIKKRIIMLNKKTNPKNNSWKIALIFPALLAFMLNFNTTVQAQVVTEGTGKVEVSPENKKIGPLQEQNPLIILNGEIKKNDFDMNSISPEKVERIDVLKGNRAISLYGKAAVDGVILISTEVDGNNKKISKGYAGKTDTIKFINQPLIIVDGKEMGENFKVEGIDPEEIKSVNVLKGETATEKYGKEGEKGAIEVTLKTD